jgi:hypothetical protein
MKTSLNPLVLRDYNTLNEEEIKKEEQRLELELKRLSLLSQQENEPRNQEARLILEKINALSDLLTVTIMKDEEGSIDNEPKFVPVFTHAEAMVLKRKILDLVRKL